MQTRFTATLASDVASGGTVSINYPAGVSQGQFTYRPLIGDSVFLDGGNPFNRSLWSASFGATSVTITNSTGGTWYAGQRLTLTASQAGLSRSFKEQFTNTQDLNTNPVFIQCMEQVFVSLGVLETASTTFFINAAAVTGTGPITVLPTVSETLAARTVRVQSSDAGDTTQTATILGRNFYGEPIRQVVTLNGTTIVVTTKAFKKIDKVIVSAAMAGTLSVGISTTVGMPVAWDNILPIAVGAIELVDGAVAGTPGTFTVAASNYELDSGSDAFGTWTPNSAPNATRNYGLLITTGNLGFVGRQNIRDVINPR